MTSTTNTTDAWTTTTSGEEDQKVLEFCKCGCGRESIPGLEDHAILLRRVKAAERTLHQKLKAGKRRRKRGEELLWALGNALPPLNARTHRLPAMFRESPSWGWTNQWIEEVEGL